MVETALRQPPQISAAGWLRTLAPAARWVLHADRQARSLAAPVWGAGFAETACRALVAGSRATLWLGPDEYLLLDFAAGSHAEDEKRSIAGALEDSMAACPHALVDISHRQFGLEVSGSHACTILSGACPLDLDADAFPIGMCTRTVLAKADIVLWRTRADAFHLEVWRSFSGYVGALLAEIAREFYGP